jgi:hypothetical protein
MRAVERARYFESALAGDGAPAAASVFSAASRADPLGWCSIVILLEIDVMDSM